MLQRIPQVLRAAPGQGGRRDRSLANPRQCPVPGRGTGSHEPGPPARRATGTASRVAPPVRHIGAEDLVQGGEIPGACRAEEGRNELPCTGRVTPGQEAGAAYPLVNAGTAMAVALYWGCVFASG
jgi:hypothetical protein